MKRRNNRQAGWPAWPQGGGATVLLATVILSACGAPGGRDSAAFDGRFQQRATFEGPVPRAECGPNDPVENGLQGQVPLEDRVSGRSLEAYACNMELVSQVNIEGASWQHAWHDDCAYYDTASLNIAQGALPDGVPVPPKPGQMNPGTVVIDASDSANPQVTDILTTAAMIDPWESLKVNFKRELLAGVELGGPGFAIYDLSEDCAQPVLLADVTKSANGHEGEWIQDGNTYWGSDSTASYHAIDTSDPTNPEMIIDWGGDFFTDQHGMGFSEDGNTGYFTNQEPNGLVIADISEVQQRQPNPEVRVLSELYWTDGATAQHTQAFTIDGHPYILFIDEQGHGAARIIDVSDPTDPFIISKLKLEVHMPENAEAIQFDTQQGGFFGYEAHYCAVFDGENELGGTAQTIHDAELVACGYVQSGLRIFDIRDPFAPREIAYYYPPAQPGYQPGSNYALTGVNQTAPYATSAPRIHFERNEVWFTSQENGFQIVRFTKPLSELMGPAP